MIYNNSVYKNIKGEKFTIKNIWWEKGEPVSYVVQDESGRVYEITAKYIKEKISTEELIRVE